MSFFDDIFGGSNKKTTTSGATTTDVAKTQATEQVGTKETAASVTGTAEQAGAQTAQTFQLSPENIAILNNLIANAAGKETIYSPATKNAVQSQTDLTAAALAAVTGAGANTDAIVKSAQEAAKLNFAENQGAQISQFADVVGSKLNSTSQLLMQKGDRDLATQLAAIEGDIRLKGRELGAQELAIGGDVAAKGAESGRALDLGQSQALQDVLAALGVSKGAATTGVEKTLTSGVTSQQSLEQQISQELMREILALQSKEVSTGTTKQSGGGSFNLLDVLQLFNKPQAA